MLTAQARHYRGQAEHYMAIARTTRSLRDGGTYRKMAQAFLKLAEDEDRFTAAAERRNVAIDESRDQLDSSLGSSDDRRPDARDHTDDTRASR
jgi:hypothetical protein